MNPLGNVPPHELVAVAAVCFWCGSETGQIVLVKETDLPDPAARKVVASYRPCNSCRETRSAGITFMEISPENPKSFQPIGSLPDGVQVYPTGEWWVVSEEMTKELIEDERSVRFALRLRSFYVDSKVGDILRERMKHRLN